MQRLFLSIIALVCLSSYSSSALNSNGTDSFAHQNRIQNNSFWLQKDTIDKKEKSGDKKFSVELNLSSSRSLIANDWFGAEPEANMGYTTNLHFRFFIVPNISIGTGVEMNKYYGISKLDFYESAYPATDLEDSVYSRIVSATGITEKQTIIPICVPLFASYSLPVSDKDDIRFTIGAKAMFHQTKEYTSQGIFSYKAYYEQWNVELSNIPELGLVNNQNESYTGELQIKPITYSIFVSADMIWHFDPMYVKIGFSYERGITDILDYKSYIFEPDGLTGINSLMASSNKTVLQSSGIVIGMGIRF